MTVALDTNVVVDLMRREANVRANYDRWLDRGEELHISALVLQELLFGIELSGSPRREGEKLSQVLRDLEVVPFETSDAEAGGRVQAGMERRGQRAPPVDLIIGAHALARGAALATANTRHFQNIPGLKLLNWRLPPEQQDAPHA